MLQEEFENIENYLNGTLEDEVLQHFEQRIANDPELARRVNEQRLLNDAIEEASFRATLENFRKK